MPPEKDTLILSCGCCANVFQYHFLRLSNPIDSPCLTITPLRCIVKAERFEGLLSAFCTSNNFLSFVRQLFSYGFSKVERPLPCPEPSQGASGDFVEPFSWESLNWEFKHPKFRRGHKGLLTSIKRLKSSGRLKRRRVGAQMIELEAFRKDVEEVSADLRAMDDRVTEIKSLLVGMVRRRPKSYAAPPQHPQRGGNYIGVSNLVFKPIPTPQGGGAHRWCERVEQSKRNPYTYGSPFAFNSMLTKPSMNNQRQTLQHHNQPCLKCNLRERLAVLHQTPLAVGSAPQQLVRKGLPSSPGLSWKHNEGEINIPTVCSPSRGGGPLRKSSLPSVPPTTSAIPHDTYGIIPRIQGPAENSLAPDWDSEAQELQQDLSEGRVSMLEVLSRSAANAARTEKNKYMRILSQKDR